MADYIRLGQGTSGYVWIYELRSDYVMLGQARLVYVRIVEFRSG
jgi:hypothetical protein